MAKISSEKAETPSQLIDARIQEQGDWRGAFVALIRAAVSLNESR